MNETSLLRLNPDEKIKQDSIILNSTLTSPKTIKEVPTKNFVDNKFKDPSIKKRTQIMLTSMIKNSITLNGLKSIVFRQFQNT